MAEATAISLEQARATIDEFFSAISRGDAAAAAATFAQDASVEDPHGSEAHTGRAAIEAFYAGMSAFLQSISLGARDVYISGDGAAATWHAAYTGKNGRSGEVSGIDVYSFDGDGRFTSLTGYWDVAKMIADVSA